MSWYECSLLVEDLAILLPHTCRIHKGVLNYEAFTASGTVPSSTVTHQLLISLVMASLPKVFDGTGSNRANNGGLYSLLQPPNDSPTISCLTTTSQLIVDLLQSPSGEHSFAMLWQQQVKTSAVM